MPQVFEIKKGQPIFFEDRLIARFSRNQRLSRGVGLHQGFVEFHVNDNSKPWEKRTMADDATTATAPLVAFTVDYARGGTVIWSSNRDFTSEEFALNSELLVPERAISDISTDLTHSNLVKALTLIKLVHDNEMPLTYLSDIPGLSSRLDYGIEMHTHFADSGKDQL